MTTKGSLFEHRYFSSYPVESESEALWLSKEPTFAIIKILWEAGPKGLTAAELIGQLEKQKTRVGRSIVYQTLKALKEREVVEREWDNEIGARRNILSVRWLPAILDDDFGQWIEEHLDDEIERMLFPAFLKFLQTTMERSQKKGDDSFSEFLPRQSKEAWCHNCDLSHEAQFFFLGLLYAAANAFVFSTESREFKDSELAKSIARLYTEHKLASKELVETTTSSS